MYLKKLELYTLKNLYIRIGSANILLPFVILCMSFNVEAIAVYFYGAVVAGPGVEAHRVQGHLQLRGYTHKHRPNRLVLVSPVKSE